MNEHKNNTGAAGGLSFYGLLTIAFIVLKLTGVIDWSWLWVLAPAWIPAAIAIAVILVVLVVVLVEARKYGLERQQGESDLDLKRRIAFFKQEARRARHE